MVNQRPHILKYALLDASEASFQDVNGDWIKPANTSTPKQLGCRAEHNGRGDTIPTEDGSVMSFAWKVYLDAKIEEIPYGTKVEVFKGTKLIAFGKVKSFDGEGQLNTKLWL